MALQMPLDELIEWLAALRDLNGWREGERRETGEAPVADPATLEVPDLSWMNDPTKVKES